ncbi:MAG TPA: sigma-54 dependent transcriptional regulator [Casimicrobiaceae bacterium]|nr:sigma-54 dependent transcriptional regulator [Casimicrobiaceae bacterium]
MTAHRLASTAAAASVAGHAAAVVDLLDAPDALDVGLAMVAELKKASLPIIAHATGAATWPISTRCRVLLAGARYVMDDDEPGFRNTLKATLADVLAIVREERTEACRLRALARAHGIVGESFALMDAFRSVVRMSKLSDLPVLITGESGTGKELFASVLHALDPKRCTQPLLAVNCAAINAGVAESELFGHVRGAFTGAGRDHSGYFLAAQGGVLFLDEIGELDLDVQAKILRVLQEKRLYRVGAGHDASVDIRIVAATNRDLGAMVEAGRFRADLFHRLNTLSVHISPLRERLADVPLLVEHFVAAHSSWRAHTGIDSDLADALSHLPLPGNVRELENLIATAQAGKTDRSPLGLKDLPPRVWKELAASGFAPAEAKPVDSGVPAPTDSIAHLLTSQQGWNLDRCLAHCEREIVAAALVRTRHNQSQAARMLGLTPRSIYNKLRKHQLLRKPDA